MTVCARAECFALDWRSEKPNHVMYTNARRPRPPSARALVTSGERFFSLHPQFETSFGLSDSNSSSFRDIGRGRIPEYIVEATSAEDVVKGVEFARRHKLRLRIKRTGHDYVGRSSDPGSFTIWTHRLKSSKLHPHFIPHGADVSVASIPALVVGSGTQVHELYASAEKAGVVVTRGSTSSVGVAGGFSLGGGHGPLSPLHGLAADNILEITVVLANGAIVRASAYNHKDLFAALRGGGSAFGVVIEMAFRAHTPPQNGFIGVIGDFSVVPDAKDPEGAWQALIRELVALQPALSDAGLSGYSYIRKTQDSPFFYVLPRTSKSKDVDFAKSFAPLSSPRNRLQHQDRLALYVVQALVQRLHLFSRESRSRRNQHLPRKSSYSARRRREGGPRARRLHFLLPDSLGHPLGRGRSRLQGA